MADKKPFFIGYIGVPKGLGGFMLSLTLSLIAFMTFAGILIGATQDDPGDGAFLPGRQTVSGVIEFTPYPILRVTSGSERVPEGHTLMLTGQGKQTISTQIEPMTGDLVEIQGIVLKRGTLDMMQVAGGRRGPKKVEGPVPPVEPGEDLGRWRLAGEICDGKCLAGAMRPGRGLAHKACANLCLIGDIPPVFVSTKPVEGSEFLLVIGPDGTRMPEAAYDFVGQFIEVEGQIERRGDLLILAMDPDTMEVAE